MTKTLYIVEYSGMKICIDIEIDGEARFRLRNISINPLMKVQFQMNTSTKPKPLLNRPWLTNTPYRKYSRLSVLHVDAYLIEYMSKPFLLIDYVRGGRVQVARDAWLIEPHALTPVWFGDALKTTGTRQTYQWGLGRGLPMGRVHARVLAQARAAKGPWSRVAIQAHYIRAGDLDGRPNGNTYKPRAPYRLKRPRVRLPDWL